MYRLSSNISRNAILVVCLLIILLINFPYFVLGQGIYDIFGYDNLDSMAIAYKLLAESGKLFANSSDILAQPLSGLPRVCFPSEFSFITWLYVILKPNVAYVINIVLIQLIAFMGMQLLLKKLNKSNDVLLIYAVSLIFSQLNFWPYAGISIAGLPLIYFAYITFREKAVLSILILLFYALYSNLVLVGIFLIAILSLDVLTKILRKKNFTNDLIFVLILIIFYLIIEYRLILSIFNPIFISHRTEFVSPTFGYRDALSTFIQIVFREYGHNVKHPRLIVLTTIIFIVFQLFREIKNGKRILQIIIFIFFISALVVFIQSRVIVLTAILFTIFQFFGKIKIERYIPNIIILIVFLSALSVFMQSTFMYSFTSKVGFLRTIQLQRFYWLLPPLYYVLFFHVLEKTYDFRLGKLLVILLLLVQFRDVVSANPNSAIMNLRQIVNAKVFLTEKHQGVGTLTYNQFYSEKLYAEIKSYIGKEQSSYRVASFGLQPAAALYSGFYTIDGYFGNYPIEHKRSFYKIISKELERNKVAYDFFMNFGSVLIILSDEEINMLNGKDFIIPTFYKNEGNRIIHHLEINTVAMREMNCQYVISAFRIENSIEINMNFEKYFERNDSPYGIYLYSINMGK